MEGSRCIERADGMLIVALEVHLDSWRTSFFARLSDPIDPAPILNDMNNGSIINKVDALAFFDGDSVLQEVRIAHMDRVVPAPPPVLPPLPPPHAAISTATRLNTAKTARIFFTIFIIFPLMHFHLIS